MSKKAKKSKDDFKTVYVPVVNGVAVMPDGRRIEGILAREVAVPVLTKAGRKKFRMRLK